MHFQTCCKAQGTLQKMKKSLLKMIKKIVYRMTY